MIVSRLGRSIHYININYNILDIVKLAVFWNEYQPALNVVRLGKSNHTIIN